MSLNESFLETDKNASVSLSEPVAPFTFLTPLLYLLGSRRAIRTLVATPGALWLGLALVGTAGLAREYDGEYLLAEPWHLLIPLAASLGTSFLLYNLLFIVTRRWGLSPIPYWNTYCRFLTLYWMTAPLAWLYAIPVERYCSAGTATELNLNLLFIVALWRVVLIIRASSVLLGDHWWKLLFPIMFFADGVALFLLQFISVPLLAFMGGIRLTESESVISDYSILVYLLGWLSSPIWAFGSLTALLPGTTPPLRQIPTETLRLPKCLWILPITFTLIIAAILPWTQAEQRLRLLVERDFAQGRFDEGLTILSENSRNAFPPHWDPPPHHPYYKADHMELLKVLSALENRKTEPWVRDVFKEKYERSGEFYWYDMDVNEFADYLDLLNSFEIGRTELFRRKDKILEYVERYSLSETGFSRGSLQRMRKLLETLPSSTPLAPPPNTK